MKEQNMQLRRRFFLTVLCALSINPIGCTFADDSMPKVSLKTNMGEIVLELNPAKAPKSVDNFLKYIKEGHYSGTIFHRVINGFMIQGGGYNAQLQELPPHSPIENESGNGLGNETYTIAMARTGSPHSATAQFFINVNDNTSLDYREPNHWGYAVFGKVISGKDVVNKIKQVQTTAKSMVFQNFPVEPIIIESATVIK
jgi:cyclophilin family peptidyl-prolyl cis-trans isomerase